MKSCEFKICQLIGFKTIKSSSSTIEQNRSLKISFYKTQVNRSITIDLVLDFQSLISTTCLKCVINYSLSYFVIDTGCSKTLIRKRLIINTKTGDISV